MIGRRCTHSDVFSRPVLIARNLSVREVCFASSRVEYGPCYLSQDIYCGGYCGGDPPLPIPNREVKPAIADGTAPPGGRVGSCRSLEARLTCVSRASSFMAGVRGGVSPSSGRPALALPAKLGPSLYKRGCLRFRNAIPIPPTFPSFVCCWPVTE